MGTGTFTSPPPGMSWVIDGLFSESWSLNAKKLSNSQPKQANEVKNQAGHNLVDKQTQCHLVGRALYRTSFKIWITLDEISRMARATEYTYNNVDE
jgi:hypothetical protein